jgi:hypothetical protein
VIAKSHRFILRGKRIAMAKPRAARQFLLIVVDRDTREFNVLGPMVDDTALTNAVCDAQRTGRSVNCFSEHNELNVAEVATRYSEESGYVLTSRRLV